MQRGGTPGRVCIDGPAKMCTIWSCCFHPAWSEWTIAGWVQDLHHGTTPTNEVVHSSASCWKMPLALHGSCTSPGWLLMPPGYGQEARPGSPAGPAASSAFCHFCHRHGHMASWKWHGPKHGDTNGSPIHTYIHTNLHAGINTYMYVYIYTYVHMHIYIYIYIHIYIYTCNDRLYEI